MKKGMLVLGSILLVLGLGLSWTGTRLGGCNEATVRLFGHTWSLHAPMAGRYGGLHLTEAAESAPSIDAVQAYGQVPSERFFSLSLDVDVGDVTVAAGDDYGVSFEYWGDDYAVRYGVNDGGTMMIWSEGSGDGGCGSSITVYVPAGETLEDVCVNVNLGSVTLAGLTANTCTVDADLGDVTGEGLNILDTTVVNASLGDVSLYGNLGESLEVDADLGDVTLGLDGPAADYCWDLDTDLGSIRVDGRRENGGSVVGGEGTYVIWADADLGSIQVDFDCVTGIDSMAATAEDTATGEWAVDRGQVTWSVPAAPEAPAAPEVPAVPEVPQTGMNG